MQQDSNTTQVTDLTKEFESGVKFDPEAVSLFGVYKDELSLFRAKKSWTEILEANFLLEPKYDYNLLKISRPEQSNFILQCSFLTACGRYAFWRLTNDQAPEAQYLIETAHIPNSDLASDMFISAPDMSPFKKPASGSELDISAEDAISKSAQIIKQVKKIIENLSRALKPAKPE